MRVAVLKGGRGLERQVSLRSGARVEDALAALGHEVVAIDVGAELVATLQAFIFSTLTAIYIGGATAESH